MNIIKTESSVCSVCCLCYNHAPFIKECIESIWKQTYRNIEICVLDDGSTDGSFDILTEMSKQSPFPMKVHTQTNTGSISKNCNTLLRLATGKYFVIMSTDDMLVESGIANKIAILESNQNMVFAASTRNYCIGSSGKILKEQNFEALKELKTSPDLLDMEHERIGSFYLQGAVIRRIFIDKVGGYDEDLLGDDIVIRTKLFLHMREHPELTFSILDEYGFYYRMHDNNIHKNAARQVRLVCQVLDRYYPDRPTPLLLHHWVISALTISPLQDAFDLFCQLPRIRELLEDEKIQYAIYARSKKELGEEKIRRLTPPKPLRRYIFERRKEGNKRTLIFFSCIKIRYQKRNS